MTAQKTKPAEFTQQKLLLFSTIGEEGSGYDRYSSAMYFYKLGLVSVEMLEIYRRCCKFDDEDPIALANHEGINPVCENTFDTFGMNQQ